MRVGPASRRARAVVRARRSYLLFALLPVGQVDEVGETLLHAALLWMAVRPASQPAAQPAASSKPTKQRVPPSPML